MRFGFLEILRFLASIAIVAWHVPDLGAGMAVTWSLPFFVLLSVVFGLSARNGSALKTVRRRAAQFLVPWLLWSGLYLVLRLLRHRLDLGFLIEEFQWPDLLIGTALPLWYLPFIFLALSFGSIIEWISSRDVESASAKKIALGIVALVPLAVLFSKFLGELKLEPFPQYAAVIPSVMLGFIYQLECGRKKATKAGLVLPLLGALLLVVSGVAIGWRWQPTLTAYLLVLAFMGLWPTDDKKVLVIGRISWPIYLVHPIWVGCFFATDSAGITSMGPVLIFVCSVFLSILSSGMLLAWPFGNRLLLEGSWKVGRRTV
ncbi:MAG: acyltransferase [Planctomycetes bacterium]|nr:acyltransferase [Planctomycetota bacterium]